MSKEPDEKADDEQEELEDEANPAESDDSDTDEDDASDEDSDDDASEEDGDESDDEDADDASDGEEEEEDDEEAEAAAAAAEAAARKKKRKRAREQRAAADKPSKRLEKPVLPPETAINAPSRQTLGMIGVMALATLVMWGTAKTACNAHPAQTRKPRALTVAELSKDPKAAALEMAQRWASYDFDGALELATDKVEAEIKTAKGACEKDSACSAAAKKEYDTALAKAALLGREGAKATVRVTGLGGALEGQTKLYEVELAGPTWKVARVTDKVPAPPPAPRPVPPTTPSAVPAPSGSAAP